MKRLFLKARKPLKGGRGAVLENGNGVKNDEKVVLESGNGVKNDEKVITFCESLRLVRIAKVKTTFCLCENSTWRSVHLRQKRRSDPYVDVNDARFLAPENMTAEVKIGLRRSRGADSDRRSVNWRR